MDDDFNTPRALAALFNLTRDVNVALRGTDGVPAKALVSALGLAGETLRGLGSVLGGLFESPREKVERITITQPTGTLTIEGSAPVLRVSVDEYCKARDAVELAMASGQSPPPEAIKTIVTYRALCREKKDWVTADAIRAWLANLGVVVDDIGDEVRVKTQRP